MIILLVLAHPDKKSFNSAIAETCRVQLNKMGHSVIFHDLYQEDFNPVIDNIEIPKNGQINNCIKKHCDDLIKCDGIIIVHPNWWGQPPAILKGWIDRVIRPGVAYEFEEDDNGEGIPKGLLKAKVALVFNTSNTNVEREETVFKDPLELIWKNCIFGFCGIKEFNRIMFRIVVTSDIKQRQIWLKEVEETIDRYF